MEQNNKNIVIIDDDEILTRFFHALLSREDYDVKLVSNRTAALDEINSNKPDLILIDLNLGSEDGGLLCQELRQVHDLTDIPIILMSGNPVSEEDCKTYQADGFIAKPMEANAFKTLINQHLKHC